MADERTSGFLEALGLGQVNPISARPQMIPGSNTAATFANIGRTAGRGPATQLLAGLASGVGGLITGEGGRSFGEFGRDFMTGFNNFNDGVQARDQGMTVEQLRTKRRVRKRIEDSVRLGSGSLEEQINAANETARIASEEGDIETALAAAQLQAQLKKQLEQQKQAGIETERDQISLDEERGLESLGFTASILGKEGEGKAVRIDAERAAALGLPEESIGKFLFIDKEGNQQIVDGVELVRKDQTPLSGGAGGKQDNVLALARANGATAGNISKMRGTLADMSKQAVILSDVSNLLLNMSNPEFALDLTGRTAIQANRVIRFVDNAATIVSEANGTTDQNTSYSWDNKLVSGEEGLHREFTQRGREEGFLLNSLNRIAQEEGLPQADTLQQFMPRNIIEKLRDTGASAQEIARISEQYWANVMELAYMDARLQEPSNRGLSDKDIQNALRRIGAATANPASFAQRQLTLVNRIEDAVGSLGNSITVPMGWETPRQEVVDFIFAPETRRRALDNLAQAKQDLGELREFRSNRPEDIRGMTREQLEKAIEEERAKQNAGN